MREWIYWVLHQVLLHHMEFVQFGFQIIEKYKAVPLLQEAISLTSQLLEFLPNSLVTFVTRPSVPEKSLKNTVLRSIVKKGKAKTKNSSSFILRWPYPLYLFGYLLL